MRQNAEMERLSVAAVVNDALEILSPRIMEVNVSVRQRISRDLAGISGNHVQLQQVMINLLLNALDSLEAINDRPRQIIIEAVNDGAKRVVLRIEDNGIGICPDMRKRLFQMLATSKQDGMGMGLVVSRSIVEAHDGLLQCESAGNPEQGEGAIFSITLPAAEAARLKEKKNEG